jgi:putative tryptophan/tyrosine transport system substrate-binding protein
MIVRFERREFLAGLAAAAWPLAARAQRPTQRVVGFLCMGSPGPFQNDVDALRRGLNDIGFVDGQNVAIEYGWAEGQYDRLPALAETLVRNKVAAIVAGGSNAPALVAKNATTTIPIIFSTGADPVGAGLVASLNRPEGNVTGIFALVAALEGKRLGLLHEMIPTAKLIAVLLNPASPSFESQLKDIQEAADAIGQQLQILRASSRDEIDAAFAAAAASRAGAMLVGADPSFAIWRDQQVALAARYALPAIFETHDYAEAGGLMSYGTNFVDVYRQVGAYTGRILKGEKPADLPVQQSTKFEFVINLKTAKSLGLTIPSGLLAIADEVIE